MPPARAATADKPRGRPAAGVTTPAPTWGLWLADAALIALFLALTFLLGAFPLADTDFWWHLRTGDLIRQTGQVPRTDPFTFGAAGRPWIDLHWGFQVLLSLGYAHGGVVALNLAKCAITTAAVFLLINARRRDWPIWVMLLAWLPALLLLGGRMYVRPETLSLLYLAIFLAVLTRWERSPRLAFLLPAVMVLWVNTQGLFVLGLVVLGFALIDAALAPGAFATERRAWWRTTLMACALTALACLLNPYFLEGALFPIVLAQTMSSPIFANTIAELTPIPRFIEKNGGLANLPLLIHLGTMILGGLSFVIPLAWRAAVRVSVADRPEPATAPKPKRSRRPKARPDVKIEPWRLSPFRLLLYAAFSALSWKATRNSHQFAAVVGALTAWNFGEWAAAVRRRRLERGRSISPRAAVAPRLAAFAALALTFAAVASGAVYALAGEGRTIGLGERPLWFPHEAVRAAGAPGMPDRFACFHNGHAALYEYEHGPGRKVYLDARLEIIGPELYGEYLDLQRAIDQDRPGWSERLDAMGRPGVLADNVQVDSGGLAATLLANRHWRCVWFDPVASLFVHESYPAARQPVDFLARHFGLDPAHDPKGPEAILASSKALRNIATSLAGPEHRRGDLAAPLITLGIGQAERVVRALPDSAEAWKILGQLETLRDPIGGPEPIARFRQPFDPLFDLSTVRATFALRRALESAPRDFSTLLSLAVLYQRRGLDEAALPYLERLVGLTPINAYQARAQESLAASLDAFRARLGGPAPEHWRNLDELRRAVNTDLDLGRVARAATLLERAYPPRERTWEVSDRLATWALHLGQPQRARALWEASATVPRPALRAARVAASFLAEQDFRAARRSYHEAIAAEPDLFEAHLGLAVLERDAGHADAAAAAEAAITHAPGDVARAAARAIIEQTRPYGTKSMIRR